MNSGKIEKNETSIRFCGAGGMGVILATILLGRAAIYDGKNAIQTQSYGAEQRGTKVRSDILISDEDQPTFPLFNKVDILIAFSQDAFDHFLPCTWEKSIIFINKDLVEFDEVRKKVYKIAANSIAEDLKNQKVMNVIMLGGLLKVTDLVSEDALLKAIETAVPKKYKNVNIEAFKKGYKVI
jgi:2-oxoglutarate ferredoxin oxidoreductase subunit gamma